MSETVELAPYDGEWPRRFEQEQSILTDVFEGAAAQVEHVGSTAVPRMISKPIIDIMVGVANLPLVVSRLSPRPSRRRGGICSIETAARGHRSDRSAYLEGKSSLVQTIVARAMR